MLNKILKIAVLILLVAVVFVCFFLNESAKRSLDVRGSKNYLARVDLRLSGVSPPLELLFGSRFTRLLGSHAPTSACPSLSREISGTNESETAKAEGVS